MSYTDRRMEDIEETEYREELIKEYDTKHTKLKRLRSGGVG